MVNNYNKLYLYLYGGVSGVLSKSYMKYNGTGERSGRQLQGYNNNMVYSAVFPLGAGVKFSIDPRWSVGAELGYAFSLSDEMDGYAHDYSEVQRFILYPQC